MNDASTDFGTVRVSLPASVAADLGSFKKAIGSILDRLGCPACCSGHDIFFDIQRDFTLRDLKAKPVVSVGRGAISEAVTRVGLGPKTAANIDEVFVAIDRIADLTGHPACCSGKDLRLQMERVFVLDAKLQIEEQAMRLG